jgi:two-component system, NtrC family, nitrogen regulation response regulator NtrX
MWKVLVIDDNAANRELLVEILKEHASCDTARDGQEGFDAYMTALQGKSPYDVILCDIAMPVMNGLEFLSRVREGEELAGIRRIDGTPIIMVTAHLDPSTAAFKRGCDDYILKPVNASQLLMKIQAKVCWRETRPGI